jgi:hypothetical protein
MSARAQSRFIPAALALIAVALATPLAARAQEREPKASIDATRVELSAGLGVGSRSFERPTPSGVQVLDTTPFAAADLSLRVDALRASALQLGVLVRYQTSLAMMVETQPLFALPREVTARSSRVELSVVPALRLGANLDAPRLALPVGVSARTFWPETHDKATFGYSLIGPHVRPELVWPLGPATLRVGPELQWIVAMDRALRRDGVSAQGFSIGMDASLGLALDASWGLELSYRQARAFAAGKNGRADFTDAERYVTLRLSGGF